MQRALRLALRGRGWVEPNPMVGCVIARSAKVVGEGFHRRFGGPHAEINALRSARGSARGATVYVTLEPCSHFGKTPPCTGALIEAGVRRVVAAMKDPHPEVAGRGIRKLRAAGISVAVGCLREEAVTLNRPYLTFINLGRPHVMLKWAQSIDGQITTPPGYPKAISSEAAHRWVHDLRARVDGILIGVGTARADDPLLTARGVRVRRTATRIILDARLRIRPTSRLVKTAYEIPTLVVTTRAGRKSRPRLAQQLCKAGVEVIACRSRAGRVDLADLLRRLGARNMTNIMVEGGGLVLAKFLSDGLADEAFIFVAPSLIGGDASPVPIPRAAARNASVSSRRVGVDTLHHMVFCG